MADPRDPLKPDMADPKDPLKQSMVALPLKINMPPVVNWEKADEADNSADKDAGSTTTEGTKVADKVVVNKVVAVAKKTSKTPIPCTAPPPHPHPPNTEPHPPPCHLTDSLLKATPTTFPHMVTADRQPPIWFLCTSPRLGTDALNFINYTSRSCWPYSYYHY